MIQWRALVSCVALTLAACDNRVDPPPAPVHKPAAPADPAPRITDPDPGVRLQAAAKVVSAPAPQKSIPDLIAALQHDDDAVRQTAELALAAIGAPAVPELVKQLEHPKGGRHALSVLRMLGPNAGDGVPAMIGLMDDTEFGISVRGVIEKVGRPAVPVLLDALAKGDPRLKRHVAMALNGIGADAKEAVPALEKLVSDPDPRVVYAVNKALDTIRQQTTPIPALAAGLKSPDPLVRRRSARDLGALGPKAAVAIPELIEAFKLTPLDRDLDDALSRVGKPAYLPLLPLVRSDNSTLAQRSDNLLYGYGKPPPEAMSELLAMSRSPNAYLQSTGLRLLGRFGPDGAVAIPEIAPLLQAPDENTRLGALNFLKDTKSPDAIPLIATLLRHSNDNTRGQALFALVGFGAAASAVEPQVREVLTDNRKEFRALAAKILKNIEAGKK